MAEIDVAFDGADGRPTMMSLVWIFRLRDGLIAMLRDYFSEPPSAAPEGDPEAGKAFATPQPPG